MLPAENFSPSVPALAGASGKAPVVLPEPVCAHCNAPVPPEPSAELSYCCSGCRIVREMIERHQLEGYYEERGPAAPAPALATGRDYAEFDEPAFLALYARKHGDQRTLELLLEGVHCAACVWLVEKLPELVDGVTSCRLDYARRLAYVTFPDPAVMAEAGAAAASPSVNGAGVHPSAIAQALDRLGYPPHPYRQGRRTELARREQRDLLMRIAVAGACAGNIMLLALALYSGAVSDMDGATARYFRVASLVIALPSVLWCARVFYRGALGALVARRPHMDLPLSLGILLAAVSGACNVLLDRGEIYFDSVTMLVFVLLVARYLQTRQQARAELRAGAAHALTPRTARSVDASGGVRLVPAESVPRGGRVQVLAGDAFPVDGRILTGHSQVDMSWLTGESLPLTVEPGSAVFAGTTNLSGAVEVLTEQSGAETRAARVLYDVERAAAQRAPIAVLADKVAGVFLVGVLLLAAIAFVAWLPSGAGVAFDTVIALLIVTCPCGLALATPLTVASALGQAAQRGFLIKGGAFLEALARPALIAFDKTGTLTSGRLSLVRWLGDTSLGPQIKALEAGSSHPIARALLAALESVPAANASGCRQRLGHGVEGVVDGQLVSVTAVAGAPQPLPAWAHAGLAELAAEGLTPVVVAVAGEARALLGLGDSVRPDAAETLARLSASGQRLALLSGDRQAVVDALVKRLEAAAGGSLFETARGEMSPEDKLSWVERASQSANVLMVGDGVNDAAALAAARVGIAVHGGAEASLDAAHVFSTREGVAPVLELITSARRALRVIHENLALSLVYNVIAASLTLAGSISPVWAAVIMPLSSLTVVSHAYRRRMFRGPR